MQHWTIELLGGFRVTIDGAPVAPDQWRRRHAALLVKRLALAPGRRLHREQVIDTLWPDATVDEATPRLHKAAHYARKALGDDASVVLRGDTVSLLPEGDVTIDVVEFETAAREPDDARARSRALELYRGDLLPDDLYEPFTEPRRERLRLLALELLRRSERWEDVLAMEPADEAAHVALMRRHIDEGDRHAALRQYERLDRVLGRELGVQPGPEAVALRRRLLEDADRTPAPATAPTPIVGRAAETESLQRAFDEAARGRHRTVLLCGPAGIGKSTLLRWCRERAVAASWRVGEGVAAPPEASWPYAPVLEALGELARRHPSLLDGLDDRFRDEIDRALRGGALEWQGESSHQRLFVAVVELVRLAAAGSGLVLLVDDLHHADEASLQLLHYIARCTRDDRVLVVAAYRPPPADALGELRRTLLSRGCAIEITVEALPEDAVVELVTVAAPELDEPARRAIATRSSGVPFAALELASSPTNSTDTAVIWVDAETREALQRVAVTGSVFDTDEFVALSGLDDDAAYRCLDVALEAHVIEHVGAGYRFRHDLVRDALLAELPPHRHRKVQRDAAARLAELDASPAQIGRLLARGGDHRAAVPYLLRAAETAAALGAYRDALASIDEVIAHADGDHRVRLLALRADVLAAIGDVGATNAYRDALEVAGPDDRHRLRARLARACLSSGDLAAADAVIGDLPLLGDESDAEVLLARGNLAFFAGDLDKAWTISMEAKQRVLGGDKSWQMLDLVALQGLLAHGRGEWFDTLRLELRRAVDRPDVALAVFDGYLCPAEYLLYGPTPYAEVIELAGALRSTAHRAGAMRAAAFATALIGEAALLSGDLARAEAELTDALDLHRDIEARAGEAHCLQRLAEVHLLRGDAARARELCERSIQPARWSIIALHLLQRIYGTLVRAAPDPASARAEVDRALATLAQEDWCPFCDVMFAVPAAIACADNGDLDDARAMVARAEASARRWPGTSWQAAILEARAHLAAASGDQAGCADALAGARRLYTEAGQPLDAARCGLRDGPIGYLHR